MKHKLNALAAVSMLGMTLACAPIRPAAPIAALSTAPRVPVKVAAVSGVTPAMPSDEALYTMGRSAHGAGQLTLAAARYEAVLKRAPDHVGALNALAVIHAQAERTDEALQLFDRARHLAPEAAHVHNNTGYALLRAGRLDEAELALKQAQTLDPLNLQMQQNLKLLADARAERQRTAQVAQPLSIAAPASGNETAPRLVAVAPNVYALQAATMPAPAQAPVSVPVSMPVAQADLRSIRLEVSNGVGITRLARRMANRLASLGVATARLTNARPYRQAVTEIQFVAGQDASAQSLQSRLPVETRMVLASRLQPGVQLRLVLGHDLAGQAIAMWLDGTDRQTAGLAPIGGWLWS